MTILNCHNLRIFSHNYKQSSIFCPCAHQIPYLWGDMIHRQILLHYWTPLHLTYDINRWSIYKKQYYACYHNTMNIAGSLVFSWSLQPGVYDLPVRRHPWNLNHQHIIIKSYQDMLNLKHYQQTKYWQTSPYCESVGRSQHERLTQYVYHPSDSRQLNANLCHKQQQSMSLLVHRYTDTLVHFWVGSEWRINKKIADWQLIYFINSSFPYASHSKQRCLPRCHIQVHFAK